MAPYDILLVLAYLSGIRKITRFLFYAYERETRGLFLESSGNLPDPISLYLNVFFSDNTVITDMVLGQCFHRIIRF